MRRSDGMKSSGMGVVLKTEQRATQRLLRAAADELRARRWTESALAASHLAWAMRRWALAGPAQYVMRVSAHTVGGQAIFSP